MEVYLSIHFHLALNECFQSLNDYGKPVLGDNTCVGTARFAVQCLPEGGEISHKGGHFSFQLVALRAKTQDHVICGA